MLKTLQKHIIFDVLMPFNPFYTLMSKLYNEFNDNSFVFAVDILVIN
jgi:hypothetical protein